MSLDPSDVVVFLGIVILLIPAIIWVIRGSARGEARENERLHEDAQQAVEEPGPFTRDRALRILRPHLPSGTIKESDAAGVEPLEDPPERGCSYHVLRPMIARGPYGEHAVYADGAIFSRPGSDDPVDAPEWSEKVPPRAGE